jgi:hypothetical protein
VAGQNGPHRGDIATVISGSSGAAATDVNAALPVPELHPAAKADVTKTDTAEIVTPGITARSVG